MSSAGLDFNPPISTGLDFNPAISAGLDFKPAGWGLGGGGWEMGGSEVGGCGGGEWGARRYIKRPAFYIHLRGPPGALPGTGHEKTRFQNKRETTPWAGTGPGKNQVPKIKPLGTGQKKTRNLFWECRGTGQKKTRNCLARAEVPGKKKPGSFFRGRACLTGLHAKTCYFCYKDGRRVGGEGAGLGPEGCMFLAVHMVPYCRSSGDRFFALLFQSVFMFPGTGQYLGQLCLGSWFFHGVVPG